MTATHATALPPSLETTARTAGRTRSWPDGASTFDCLHALLSCAGANHPPPSLRTNVQLKDKLRHYLATSYKYPKPVPAGLVRYLPTSDPRYKPSHRAVTASQAEAAGPPRKRPRDEREEVHSDLSSGSSGESDDGSEAASMESEGE